MLIYWMEAVKGQKEVLRKFRDLGNYDSSLN
jgi:hypothetical protein